MHHLIRMPTKAVKKFGGVVDTHGTLKPDDELEFTHFLRNGYVLLPTDNPQADPNVAQNIVGYPTEAKWFAQGDNLPSGLKPDKACWWVEFIASEGPRAHLFCDTHEAFYLALGAATRADPRHKYDVEWLGLYPTVRSCTI